MLSEYGQALSTEYVDGERIHVDGKSDSVDWRRDERLDLYAAELLELEAHWGEIEGGDCCTNECIEHVGKGVFVEHNTMGVDADSKKMPQTILWDESRDAARHAIGLLELDASGQTTSHTSGYIRVTVVGQPGIDKMRSIQTCALQELLWRGEVVMRVSYKSNVVHLFVPEKDGTYRVWRAKAKHWNESGLVDDVRTFVLIDPPEGKNNAVYDDWCQARMIKFVSNNMDRHCASSNQDGHLVFTSMPTAKQVVEMIPMLWNERTAFPGQELENLEQKQEEVRKRCALVGCVPLLVFDAKQFKHQLKSIASTTADLVAKTGWNELCEYYVGMSCSAGGLVGSDISNHFLLETASPDRREVRTTLTPISSFLLRHGLEKHFRGNEGVAAFLHTRLCRKLLQMALPGCYEHVYLKDQQNTSLTMYNLSTKHGLLVEASPNFPVLDFATSRITWYIAKAGKSPPTVQANEFVNLLLDLDLARKVRGELVMNDRTLQISLVMMRSNDDGLPENVLEKGLEGTAHCDLTDGQVKFVFDRRMLV